MKHWLWYRADGTFGGAEIMLGGWSQDHGDFTEPTTAADVVQNIHAMRSEHPDFVGYISFDCHCEADESQCRCPHLVCQDKYVKDGQIIDKESFEVFVDGAMVPGTKQRANIDRPPGANLSVVLKGNLPDGAVVNMVSVPKGGGAVDMHEQGSVPMTFTTGVSSTAHIIVPPKGFTGLVCFRPVDETHSSARSLQVRGW